MTDTIAPSGYARRPTLRSRVAVLLLVAAGLLPARAAAQSEWAVVAVATAPADRARAEELAARAHAALEVQGEAVLDPGRVRARIDAELGQRFVAADPDLVTRVVRAAEVVLDDVSFGRNDRALATGEPIYDELAAQLVPLGRLDVGRDVANLCLYLVRADIQLQRTDRARERALRCLRASPDLQVDERLHPPGVRDLVAELRAALEGGRDGGILSVQTAPGDPEGCVIRVNGRVLGRAPWIRVPLPVGSYGVQVECTEGAPARVFAVEVRAAEATRLTVPARLVGELETGTGTCLVYDSASSLDARLAEDVATLARAAHAARVLVAIVAGSAMMVRAFDVTGDAAARLAGSADIAALDDTASRAAVHRARTGQHVRDPALAPPAPAQGGGDVGVAVLGGSLLTVGVVGLGLSWYFWTEIDARGQELNRAVSSLELTERQRAFDEARTPVIIAGAAGGLLSAIGASFLTAQSSELVPWWSWMIGGAGLIVGAIGVYVLTTEGACYGNPAVLECARSSPTWLLGALVLEHAAPLLAVPITSWIRAAVGTTAPAPAATLSLSAEGASLTLYGAF